MSPTELRDRLVVDVSYSCMLFDMEYGIPVKQLRFKITIQPGRIKATQQH